MYNGTTLVIFYNLLSVKFFDVQCVYGFGFRNIPIYADKKTYGIRVVINEVPWNIIFGDIG